MRGIISGMTGLMMENQKVLVYVLLATNLHLIKLQKSSIFHRTKFIR